VGICLAVVTSVTTVTTLKQIHAKNQTIIIINEINSNDPKNTPKNNSPNPQKLVTSVTLVTK